MADQIAVLIQPDGLHVLADRGTLVSDITHDADIDLHLPCAGRGTCGKCRFTVIEGSVSEPTDAERKVLDESDLAQGVRLACQTRVLGDAVILVPATARVIGTKSLDGELVRPVALEPNVRQIPVKLDLPALEDQRSDFDRLATALEPLVPRLHACPPALQRLPEALRADDFQVVASVVGSRLVDVHPGLEPPRTLGVAVDIGTTTVVAYVVDLLTGKQLSAAAAYNEQGRHGADVISRIEYSNSHEGGLEELRELVVGTVNGVIDRALEGCDCRHEEIYEVTVVGNTAMNHLFMGLDPRYVAQAPYIPVSSRPQELRPADAGLRMNPRGNVFCLPVIAGFVGADTVGVILATDMIERPRPVLAVDIGTNGEVALWTGKKLLVTSCAAGPAFEGAQIEHGMRAAPGAIEHISIDGDDITVQTIDGQEPVGICGSGLFDALAVALELGVVDQGGRFANGSLPEGMSAATQARIVGEGNDRRFLLSALDAARPVYLSQRDVRELQLAKGAVRAAIELLLQFSDLRVDDLDEILLAGAFGNYIDPASALRMGMLPPVPLERIKGVGNAAGAGALLALISKEERRTSVQIAASAEHIELSRRPEFQMAFMETMMFP